MATPQDATGFAALTGVSRETLERLTAYERLLRRWAPRMNLVARDSLDSIWSRHFLDCHQLLEQGGAASRWVDLGAGAGFPGLVLAACGGDGTEVSLVEASQKKCVFLREAARAMGVQARVEIIGARVEDVAPFAVQWVTARAFRPLPELMTHAMGFFSLGASGLFLKGERVHSEIVDARERFRFEAHQTPSVSGAGCVFRVSQVEIIAHDGACTGIGESKGRRGQDHDGD